MKVEFDPIPRPGASLSGTLTEGRWALSKTSATFYVNGEKPTPEQLQALRAAVNAKLKQDHGQKLARLRRKS